jgi:hypothetical protein
MYEKAKTDAKRKPIRANARMGVSFAKPVIGTADSRVVTLKL